MIGDWWSRISVKSPQSQLQRAYSSPFPCVNGSHPSKSRRPPHPPPLTIATQPDSKRTFGPCISRTVWGSFCSCAPLKLRVPARRGWSSQHHPHLRGSEFGAECLGFQSSRLCPMRWSTRGRTDGLGLTMYSLGSTRYAGACSMMFRVMVCPMRWRTCEHIIGLGFRV